MSEQSQGELAGGIQGLADFLSEQPVEDSQDEEVVADTEPEQTDNQDESAETEQEESEESEEESEDKDAAEETAPRVYKVPVKGDDGQDTEVEVSEDELIKGYMRQAHFTRETQALSQRERDATQLLAQKHTEYRDYYLQQAEAAKQAVLQIAGIKSQAELAELAVNDPAAWVAEQQRQQYLSSILGDLDQQVQVHKQQAERETAERQAQEYKQQFQSAWNELQKEGITREKLSDLYSQVSKNYGVPEEVLKGNMDAKAVLIMRDAMAYRTLQTKAKETAKVAKEAPRIPNKQNTPQQTRKAQSLDAKFKSGKAKLNDLAELLR